LSLPLNGFKVSGLLLADYDNDGWLDLFAYGSDGVRVWRNGRPRRLHRRDKGTRAGPRRSG